MTQITKEAIEAAAIAMHELDGDHKWVDASESARESARRYAIAALSTLPIAGEGKVKALEWNEADGGNVRLIAVARTPFGSYFIEHETEGFVLTLNNIGLLPHPTFAAAKAAAQTDYETRLLSALVSSPGKDGGQEVEAVGEQWRVLEDGSPKTSWYPVGYGEEAGWRDIATRHPDTYQFVTRPVFAQPASTALVERLTKALEEITDTRCVHDMGFDREIGPLGCSLGDKCVCVGLCTIASQALRETSASSQSTSREGER